MTSEEDIESARAVGTWVPGGPRFRLCAPVTVMRSAAAGGSSRHVCELRLYRMVRCA